MARLCEYHINYIKNLLYVNFYLVYIIYLSIFKYIFIIFLYLIFMSKFVPKRTFPPEKNIFISQTIPETFKDQIRTLSTSGEYGKLKELLIQFPVNLSFAPSLLHGVIQSTLTDIQKIELVKLLIERGVSINNLESGVYIFNVVLENGKTAQFNVVKR